MKTCTKCKEVKSYEFFYKDKAQKDKYHHQCKICVKEYQIKNKEQRNKYQKEYRLKNKQKAAEFSKKYIELNKEKIANYKKDYYLKNKEKISKYRNEWRNNKFKNDYLFKLTSNIRTIIKQSFRRNGYSKKSRTYQILGCTFEEFKMHLEKQFTKGMSWENSGEWHLDHIYPVSLAKDEEELIKINHYTNFQPMWAIDNIKKSNKIIDNIQLKLI